MRGAAQAHHLSVYAHIPSYKLCNKSATFPQQINQWSQSITSATKTMFNVGKLKSNTSLISNSVLLTSCLDFNTHNLVEFCCRLHFSKTFNLLNLKDKILPQSLASVGPAADPGVQAVSAQVTLCHPPGGRLPLLYARPAVTFPAHQPVPNYTAW